MENTKKQTLLLHVCCAPCSSSVIEVLRDNFDITLYFYNPNITSREEYDLRLNELKRLVLEMPKAHGLSIIEGEYSPEEFFTLSSGLEREKEGGKRCALCYEERLLSTANKAEELGFDFFTTTLTVSPYKNAKKLNEIGVNLAKDRKTEYLVSDFKKKDGYKRSIELSKKYGLYRQDYCGCIYSKKQREEEKGNIS